MTEFDDKEIRQIESVNEWVRASQQYTLGSYVLATYPAAVQETTAQTVGRWLRVLRKQQGLTQQHVADLTGWSRQKISDIERGVVEVGFLEVLTLTTGYGATPFHVIEFRGGDE